MVGSNHARARYIKDDPDIGGFAAKGLTEAGYTVDLVLNGEDGLHLALLTPAYDALATLVYACYSAVAPETDVASPLRFG